MRTIKYLILFVAFISIFSNGFSQNKNSVETVFYNPPAEAKPWVLWYWMHAAVSKEGITADLEAMKSVGIEGAYLVCIYDTVSRIPFDKPARQLSPLWWEMVNHAFKECKRLGLKLAFHVSDGFALAGGPWIRPEQSMQKLVWSKTYISGTHTGIIKLKQPEAKENFYKDIAVFAYPANSSNNYQMRLPEPIVSTSIGADASFLSKPGDDSKTFRSDTLCWIQYQYDAPFTLRSLKTYTGGNNYQSQRLILQSSNDGKNFKTILRLQPPRHGWQDTDEDYTFSIPETTATYFRFVYDKTGTEPGSEDLDAAKWKPTLKIKGLYLSDEPVINQIEAKNGSIWRVAEYTTAEMVPASEAVPLDRVINLTDKMDADGKLNWKPASGNWVVVRIGHTSTGHVNVTGGAAKGLECDKFSVEAIKLQYDNWFGKVYENTDSGLVEEVLKIFYIDSWEAGSQNWSANFLYEFKKRRGYDLLPYLLLMTGVPVESVVKSEKILHDVRETIAELVNDIFYKTLRKLADQKDLKFNAENVSPTMVSDGLLHFKTVDYPTGEFWLNSPTHDKPNDMFDAITAAHIYGKRIIQAEAFTTLRMDWTAHPGSLKAIGDRNFAMGINRMVFHVNALNPWLDKKPGMTLGGIGLFFQRDQTWYNQSKAWIDHITRVSAVLQQGSPVTDIAVFIGEEIPRRSVLPDRLAGTLPGIIGEKRIEQEKRRLLNQGQPQRTKPIGVSHSANMADPENWTDALNGYKYDCFNSDVLMQMRVKDGKVITPGGTAYSVLVIPGKHPMQPNQFLSIEVAAKLLQLAKDGANIIMPPDGWGTYESGEKELEYRKILSELFSKQNKKGRVIAAPFFDENFEQFGVQPDVKLLSGKDTIAWTHRGTENGEDVYFVSNQLNERRKIDLSFRQNGKGLTILDPVSGKVADNFTYKIAADRAIINLDFEPAQSFFFVFVEKTSGYKTKSSAPKFTNEKLLSEGWRIQFDSTYGGPREKLVMNELKLWNETDDPGVKYYSGSAVYYNQFAIKKIKRGNLFGFVWKTSITLPL
ncbi:MAG: DNA-binding protein [Sphingobacteriales bacterium]|nr:DNA-binding protein [Sphingobacteriales bacterium]